MSYQPTGLVLLTFKGVSPPKYVRFYGLEHSVCVYVSPVTQCFRCLRYGHTKNCKGKEKCFNCAEDCHLKDPPENNLEYPCVTKCFYCKNDYKTTSKKCPEYNRQKNIKEPMAHENITFFDAHEICKKTYVVKDQFIYNKYNSFIIKMIFKLFKKNLMLHIQKNSKNTANNFDFYTHGKTFLFYY